MAIVTIRVASLNSVKSDTLAAMKGDNSKRGEFITFLSWEALYKALSPKRMDILKVMTGAGELSFRDIATRVNRDVKGVHTDITTLLNCGIVERGNNGVFFPYDGMHVEFTIGKAVA